MAYFTASCDDVETNTDFAKSLDLDYPILSDPEGKAAKAFGVFIPGRNIASRTTFLIDKNGNIAEIDKGVQAASHAADLILTFEKLSFPKK